MRRGLLLALVLVLAACGGGGKKQTYTRDAVAGCLKTAGATGIAKLDAGQVPGGYAQAGAIQAAIGRTRFALVFEKSDDDAVKSGKKLYDNIAGPSAQSQVIADVLVTRSHNVVIAFEQPPGGKDEQAVDNCLGGRESIKKVVTSG